MVIHDQAIWILKLEWWLTPWILIPKTCLFVSFKTPNSRNTCWTKKWFSRNLYFESKKLLSNTIVIAKLKGVNVSVSQKNNKLHPGNLPWICNNHHSKMYPPLRNGDFPIDILLFRGVIFAIKCIQMPPLKTKGEHPHFSFPRRLNVLGWRKKHTAPLLKLLAGAVSALVAGRATENLGLDGLSCVIFYFWPKGG